MALYFAAIRITLETNYAMPVSFHLRFRVKNGKRACQKVKIAYTVTCNTNLALQ